MESSNKAWYRKDLLGIKRVREQLRRDYSANPELAPTQLTMSQIRSRELGYPTFKAQAAQTHHLAGDCLALAQRRARGAPGRPPFAFRPLSRLGRYSAEYRRIEVACFEDMVGYIESLRELFVANQCKAHMLNFLQSLSALQALWRRGLEPERTRKLPWHVRPKGHMPQHLVVDQLKCGATRATSGVSATKVL